MKIVHFSEINSRISQNPTEFIQDCCNEYDRKCAEIAQSIAELSDRHPLILLAGPSGSGKTTTALKLERVLDSMGCETHTISMDDYFLPMDKLKADENGQIDFESPYRIDIALLQEHMMKLASCEEIEIPSFDFKTQSRGSGKSLKRKRGELVLFEGIHALNPEVTGFEDIATMLYVSVRTRIQMSNGELFHPDMLRVMRRIIRDRNYRNREPRETLEMFESVKRGENLYINPYKQRAHFELDTFLEFEPSAYITLLIDEFEQLKSSYDGYSQFESIECLLKDVSCLDCSLLSDDCLSREFIGGSSLEY